MRIAMWLGCPSVRAALCATLFWLLPLGHDAVTVRADVAKQESNDPYPYVDNQPFDTALGALVLSHILPDPNAKQEGPPEEDGLDGVSEGCPVLLNAPEQIDVEAPDPCAGGSAMSSGNWLGQGDTGGNVMRWSQYCSLISPGVSRAPMVDFYLPGGDYFGSSEMALELTGYTMILRDCEGNMIYTIKELILQQRNRRSFWKVDKRIFKQYVIYKNDKQVATTKHLDVMEGSIGVYDENNTELAMMVRSDGWDPRSEDCSEDDPRRKWTVTYNEAIEKVFPEGLRRWPIAELATMIALRDPQRLDNGFIRPTICEVFKTLFFFALLAGFVGLLVYAFVSLRKYCWDQARAGLFMAQLYFCPYTMTWK